MAQDDPRVLVSTEWLAAHIKDPDLRILDATYFMPGVERDARAEDPDQEQDPSRYQSQGAILPSER